VQRSSARWSMLPPAALHRHLPRYLGTASKAAFAGPVQICAPSAHFENLSGKSSPQALVLPVDQGAGAR
jgi:hypothetical protein